MQDNVTMTQGPAQVHLREGAQRPFQVFCGKGDLYFIGDQTGMNVLVSEGCGFVFQSVVEAQNFMNTHFKEDANVAHSP